MASPAAVLAILVKADTASAQASLMRTDATLKKVAASSEASAAKSAAAWQASGKKMQSVGRTLTTHVSLPIIAAGGYAIKSSLDFNKAMTLIQTQAGASRKEVERMREAVLKFGQSGKTAFSPTELAQGLYAIESAGIRGAKALDTLKQASNLAIIGQTDLASTTKALAAAQKTGIRGSENLKKAIGTMNATVGSGQMHMEDLLGAMGTGFLTSARSVGLSLTDVGGALAELTKQGIPATAAATRLRMTFTLMAAPTDKAKAALATIGLSQTDLAKKMRGPEGLVGALTLLQDHLKGLSKIQQTQLLSQAFGGARSGTTIMALLGNLDDLDSTLQNIHTHSGEVNKSLEAAKKTKAEELQIVWAQLQATLVRLGDKLIPIVIPALEKTANAVIGIVNAFNKMPGWAVDFLIGAVVLGPFIRSLGAIAVLYGKIRAAAAGAAVAEEAAAATGGAGAGGAAAGAGLAGAAAGLAAVAGGLALAVGAKKSADEVKKTQGVLGKFGAAVKDLIGGPTGVGLKGLSSLTGSEIPNNIAKLLNPLNQAKTSFNAVTHPIKSAKDALHGITHPIETASNAWGALTGSTDKATKSAASQIQNLRRQYGSFAVAARHLSKDQRNAWIDMAESARDSGDITQKQLMKLTNAFSDVGQKNRRMWRQAAQVTGQSVKSIKQSVGDMTVRVSKDYAGMVEVTGSGIRLLAKNTNQALGSLGVAKAKFMASPAAHSPQGGTRNFQRGGLIPGSGDGDKVPVMAEPGEGFINKKAVQALGGSRAIEAINKAMPRFAGGGYVGMKPGIVKLIKNVIGRFGGSMSSGFRPGDPGFHGRGMAADWVGGDWTGASRYINSIGPQLLEGIHQAPPGQNVSWDSGHKVSPSFWGASTWAEHVSHIHMAVAGAVAGAAAVKKLQRILLRGPKGALRDMGQGALDKTLKAANAYIAEQTPAISADIVAKGKGTLSPADFLAIARQAIKLTHSSSFKASGLLSLAEQESGLRVNPPPPHDVNWPNNPSMGLMQITGSNFRAYHQKGTPNNIVDPLANIAASINYQKARYGHQVTFSPYAKGGVVGPFVGSFAKGGEVAETGLAHVHKGEQVLPKFRRGGNVPHHSHLAELQMDARHLERLIHRIQHRPEPINPQVQKARDKEIKAAQARIDTDKELISELKALRAETREHNRLVKTVRVNQRSALEAVVNLTASQIGAQGLQKTRNASPGRAARY